MIRTLSVDFDKKLGTRHRGQSTRGGVAECLLFSVADGRFDPEIERFEGLSPS